MHDDPVQIDTKAGHLGIPSDLIIYPDTWGEASAYILADVAVDEDFMIQGGGEWRTQLLRTLDETNALLSPLGLHIKVHSIQQWHSDDTQHHISILLDSAYQQIERVPGHLFLAITGQRTVRYDGYAEESGSRMGIQFYSDNQGRNSSLISHEIGHLLGARHHKEEEECTEEGCIMDRRGYSHATGWCQHHQQVIKKQIALQLFTPCC